MWLLPQSNLLIYDHWMSLEPGTTIRKQPTVDPSWTQSIDCLKIVQGLVNYPRYYPCAFREKICPPCWGYRFFFEDDPSGFPVKFNRLPWNFPFFCIDPPPGNPCFVLNFWCNCGIPTTFTRPSWNFPLIIQWGIDYNPFLEKPIMLKELYFLDHPISW